MSPDARGHRAPKPSRYRWLICVLLLLITVNNYMDRQVLSIAAPAISLEYKLNNSDIAIIATAFLLAYAVGQLFSGILVDRLGARTGFSLAVAMWSLTAMVTSVARGVASFSFCRFLLGGAESVNYPGGVKVAAEWFPPQELATAVGIFQSGSSLGAMLAPPVAAFLIVHYSWRVTFIVVAIPGLLWIPLWRRFYGPVETNSRMNEVERRFILEGIRPVTKTRPIQSIRWLSCLRQRAVWGIAMARFFEEPVAWFYFTWLPIYLKTFRAVPLIVVGNLLILPFLTFDLGKVGGGWVSSRLLKYGWSLDWARKSVMLVSALCMVTSIPAVVAQSPIWFTSLVSIATFGHGCWATVVQTLPGDIIAPHRVGSVYGITAFGGSAGAIIFMQVTGKLVDVQHSFNLPFVIAGILPLLGYAAFVLLTGKVEPLQFGAAGTGQSAAAN